MDSGTQSEKDSAFADRVDRALNALWDGAPASFEKLISGDDTTVMHVADIIEPLADPKIGGEFIQVGHQVGPYRIIREVGRGGMGVVYEAEQSQPRRRVALKVIHSASHANATQVKLFEREVQALARLKHSGIAAIYDAGQTDNGRHYFAMELVRGVSLIAFVEGRRLDADAPPLSIRDRLSLFVDVCQSVHYAHQRSVIHRDLKPSNILVSTESSSEEKRSASSAKAAVKVLDFGLARITDIDVAATTLVTQTGRVIGTLRYMSPEQARGDVNDIDIRSDVYSLGVILYELLTGQLPYTFDRQMPHQAIQTILEQEPRRLSLVNRSLGGDLDTIVRKALAKDIDQRYTSAAALADDIERHLSDQPIIARPASTWYQLRKFARRNRALVSGAALALLFLVAGLLATGWQAVRASNAESEALARADSERELRRQAEHESQVSQSTVDFLKGMFINVRPAEQGRDLLVLDVLDAAVKRLDAPADEIDYRLLPETEVTLRGTLAETYLVLGKIPESIKLLEAAIALADKEVEVNRQIVLESIHNLGMAKWFLGQTQDAEQVIRSALKERTEILGAEHRETLVSKGALGSILWAQGKLEDAEPLLRETLAARQKVLPPGHPHITAAMNELGNLLREKGDLSEAKRLFEKIAEVEQRTLPADHPDALTTKHNLASVLKDMGQHADAAKLYREVLQGSREVLGESHPDTIFTMLTLASAYRHDEQMDEAEKTLLNAVECARRDLGSEHPITHNALLSMASLYADQGRLQKAEPYSREAVAAQIQTFGDAHVNTCTGKANLAAILMEIDKSQEALELLESAVRIADTAFPPDHWRKGDLLATYGRCLLKVGRREDAEVFLVEGYEILAEAPRQASQRLLIAIEALVELYEATGRPEKAGELRRAQRADDAPG